MGRREPVRERVGAARAQGVDQLLETLLLQADVLELKAPREGLAAGVVLESRLEKGRGAVATVLVKRGTLASSAMPSSPARNSAACAPCSTRPATPYETAGPSMPVVVLGLSGTPNAGDDVLVVESERKAREVALYRQGKFRDTKLAQQRTGEARGHVLADGRRPSAEHGRSCSSRQTCRAARKRCAMRSTKLSTEEVQVKVIGSGVGGITESDVSWLRRRKAIIIGFNVRADAAARDAIKESGVDVRYYSIIYEAIDDVEGA